MSFFERNNRDAANRLRLHNKKADRERRKQAIVDHQDRLTLGCLVIVFGCALFSTVAFELQTHAISNFVQGLMRGK